MTLWTTAGNFGSRVIRRLGRMSRAPFLRHADPAELAGALRRRLMALPVTPVHDSSASPDQGSGFQVNNLPVARFIVEELSPLIGFWPYPPPEMYLMVSAVCWVKPHVIVDWGTHVGFSARVFWQTTQKFGIPCDIHSVDLPEDAVHPENISERRAELVKGLPRVTLHTGDGLDVALEICGQQPGTRFLFFLDGDHTHKSVTRELQGLARAAPHAAMLLHDTHPCWGHDGPGQALKDFLQSNPGRYQTVATEIGLPGMTFVYPTTPA